MSNTLNILVIGNGFDLAHKLPTKYEDFLEFIKKYGIFNSDSLDKSDILYEYFKQIKDENVKIFNEIDELSQNNIWINYFNKIYDGMCKNGKDGWIDFENEISEIIQIFDSARLTLNEQYKLKKVNANMELWQHEFIHSFLGYNNMSIYARANKYCKEDISEFKKRMLDDLNRLTRCLEIYLSNYVEDKIEDCAPLEIINNLNVGCVISFNYTKTFETLYEKNSNKKIYYDYIHGKATVDSDIDRCNLVLGIDEYLQGEQKDKDNEFIQFKKFYQRIYKKTGNDYINFLEDGYAMKTLGMTSGFNIHIYGHSLDVTDKDILYKLISQENAKVHIYHHNQKALGEQIENLVKIIGEEKLIQLTGGNKRKIEFIPTYSQTDI